MFNYIESLYHRALEMENKYIPKEVIEERAELIGIDIPHEEQPAETPPETPTDQPTEPEEEQQQYTQIVI